MATKIGISRSPVSVNTGGAPSGCPGIGSIPGLVALWKFEEVGSQEVLDSSGNSHDGFLGTSPSVDTNDPSRMSKGLEFDFDDVVTINNTFSLTHDQPFSLFAVFKADNIDLDPSLIAKAQGPSDIKGWALLASAFGELVLYLVDNFSDPRFLAKGSVDPEIELGEYVAVLATYDGSNTVDGIKLYKNGVQITRTNVIDAGPLLSIDTSENITFGQIFTAGNNQLAGVLSILGVCNIALNQEQIIDLHNEIAAYLMCKRAIELPTAYPPAEVEDVVVPIAGFYFPGQNLEFDVRFTTPVIVTGVPRIQLTIGDVVRDAEYTSGSGTDLLRFTYTISPGDIDLDGIEAGSSIVGGTIKNIYDETADTTLPDLDTSGIIVFTLGDGIVYATSFEVNLDNDQILKSSLKGLDQWSIEAIRGNTLSSELEDPAHLLPGISIAEGQYYRSFGHHEYWSFIGSSGFSMHARIKQLGGGGVVYPVLTFSNVSSSPDPMKFFLEVSRETAMLFVQDGTPASQSETFSFSDISELWVTLSLVYDRDAGRVYLYLDGNIIDDRPITTTPVDHLVVPALGAIDDDGAGTSVHPGTTSMNMVGLLVYSVAQTSEQVMKIHEFLSLLPIPSEL